MGKHLGLKAAVLLVVIFFHSFVLVPKTYAVTFVDHAAAKAFFRAVAPSVVAATPVGWGYWLALAVQAGIIYVALKPSAVTDMKNWLNSWLGPATDTGPNVGDYVTFTKNGTNYKITKASGGYYYLYSYSGTWNQINGGYFGFSAALAAVGGSSGTSNWSATAPPPTVPTDYSTLLASHPLSFSANGVYYSPGGAAALAATGGGGAIVKAEVKTEAELDDLIESLAMTSADPATGVQAPPSTNDNTMTSGEQQSIPLLQQMLNFLSNLVGIKTDTGRMANTLDNVAATLANPPETETQSMDNVIAAINNQTSVDNAILGKVDNVAQGIESLKSTSQTQSTLTTRLDELTNLMATKFPFSFVIAVEKPDGDYDGTYSIPNIVMPMGHEIVVDPMENPQIAAMIAFVRGLVATGMWAIFIIYLIRKAAEL